MKIERDYVHKTFGSIGKATLEGEAILTLNGVELPAASVTALLNHGLQFLQDAYAGSKTTDEATSSFDKKLAKLLSGEFSVRGPRKAPLSMTDEIFLTVVKTFAGKLWAVPKGTKPAAQAREFFDSWSEKRQALVMDEVARQVAFYEADDDDLAPDGASAE